MRPVPPSGRPLRIGVVGAGSVGAAHVRAAEEAADCMTAAVCDTRADAAERLAPPGVPVYTDHAEMFARERLDAVVITAPHAFHAPMTLDAAAAGLHVLVEKPMATTVEDCTRMTAACERAGVLLAVAHVIHFDPVALRTRELLASGRYGTPHLITHRRSSHYDPGSRPDWFFDPAVAGGGIVLNVGTHGLDRIQWFGDAPVERVSGVVRGRDGLAVETDALALIGLANGISASVLLTSRGAPFFDETEVMLDEATLRITHDEGLSLLRAGRAELLAPGARDGGQAAFRAQLDGFAAAVRGDEARARYVDGAYGRSVVAAALAVYRAADEGRTVTLPALASAPSGSA
ncbi:Gfo/Idh/MocA family protein [Streptomyces genisteinicus]|uniref:Gfo/Idh/MocA family oxidoreductase n=1 Tax=Streptomyces genisteinicus TaxID=2768068 RepID=A0A7H0HNT5_9ACTN|nr:Gfo/Idh/MocA family oxidoreductase [Streptomyces genisteinicus]QNP62201.1 Gfo/Idh/MocA family oxidoreductase [Streptomyces genisteinicus]